MMLAGFMPGFVVTSKDLTNCAVNTHSKSCIVHNTNQHMSDLLGRD